MFTLAYERNEMKYIFMKEVDFVFDNEDSLVEDPNVEPSFLGSLTSKSIIPSSHGIWVNDMNNIMCYMNYDMCFVYAVVCYVQNLKYDGACYSLGITLLIKIWEVHSLSLC